MGSSKKLSNVSSVEDDMRILLGIIADEETTIGFLLAGIGESFGVFSKKRNFMMVKEDTSINEVQNFFISLYNRTNVGVILIGSDLYKYILTMTKSLKRKSPPIILEIPTKSSLTKQIKLKETKRN